MTFKIIQENFFLRQNVCHLRKKFDTFLLLDNVEKQN